MRKFTAIAALTLTAGLAGACASPAEQVKQDALAREAPVPEVTTTTVAVEVPAELPAPVVTTAPKATTTTTAAPVKRSGVTQAQYDQLAEGMSYEQAAQILGSGGEELSHSEFGEGEYHSVTVMYQWTGAADFSNMNAMFQNNELVSKAQFGLE